jgi:uncharacterized membrane protein YeaQ/YmgE (transglycosylase-associated protein family)
MKLKTQRPQSIRLWTLITLTAAIIAADPGTCLTARAADSVSDKVGAVAADTEKKIQETSEAAQTKLQELWQRIDEKRIKNRTRDEIIAWVIMGLLVGGLIQKFSKFNRATTLLLGLIGAFIGGILANVTQLNLELGPVLIRYEELLASLIGGILIVLVARWLGRGKPKKAE